MKTSPCRCPRRSPALPLVAILLSLSRVVAAQPGLISTVAGSGTRGFNGDGIPATAAQLDNPTGVFVDGSGNLFIADRSNHRVRKVDGLTGIISTVAGTGTPGYNGDDIPAVTARLFNPRGVSVDGSGNLFIADRDNDRIRKVDAVTGLISTVAGIGRGQFNGDGILATSAQLAEPLDVFVDGSGNLFITDRSNARIRKVDGVTGIISTVAGTGTAGFNGDGIPAIAAQLRGPLGVFVDGSGNLFIADFRNNRVRKVDGTTGIISTVAGTGIGGFNGDGIPATNAQLLRPAGVFVDGSGNLFIEDRFNDRIRKVDGATGIITTVAGTNRAGFNGDGILAVTAQLFDPNGVFVDGSGNLFIADQGNHRVRKVETGSTAPLLTGETVAVPDEYVLKGNYPNPFQPATSIRFSLPEASPVNLVVFDVLGRQVRVLVDDVREAGIHKVVFDADGLPGGTYLYRLETRQGSFVRTMQLAE